MPLNDDLAVLFKDFGVSCTAGGVTAKANLSEPAEVLIDDQVLSTDYMLSARTADFGHLQYGDSITVGGGSYTVRSVRKIDDGMLVEIMLQKT
tara:strand:- start:2655 stop:2933 length:279 start_codon:yes stop_codon:yes gene_type:complete